MRALISSGQFICDLNNFYLVLSKPGEPRCNVQLLYWEDENNIIRTQDPDTVEEIIRDGLNIYPLLSLDIQIINACRRDTTVTITEKMHFFPKLDDIYAAGASDMLKCPIPKQYDEFVLYLARLKQIRWDTIKKLAENENRKREMLKGLNDTLSDFQLFELSKSLRCESFNIEHSNLALARESNYISITKPAAIKLPRVRTHLTETWAENEFIHRCKPTNDCVKSKIHPFWKDGIDFEYRQEHVMYKLAEHQAQFEWKKDRQHDKDLNIRLPIGISYYQWKQDQENIRKNDLKNNYEQLLVKMNGLANDVDIDDIIMAQKIRAEEKKMKEEMKIILKRFWDLQKEKKMVSDGKIFELDMINERCLPIINGLLDRPRPAPKFEVKIVKTPTQLAIACAKNEENDTEHEKEEAQEWKGQWSD